MSDPLTDSSTPPDGKYVQERLEALHDRVEALEERVQRAAIAIQDASNAALALEILKGALMQTFRIALLCSADTTDANLDHWLPLIDKHEAESAESEAV